MPITEARSNRTALPAAKSCFAAAFVFVERAAVEEEVPVPDPEDEVVAGVASAAAFARKAVKF